MAGTLRRLRLIEMPNGWRSCSSCRTSSRRACKRASLRCWSARARPIRWSEHSPGWPRRSVDGDCRARYRRPRRCWPRGHASPPGRDDRCRCRSVGVPGVALSFPIQERQRAWPGDGACFDLWLRGVDVLARTRSRGQAPRGPRHSSQKPDASDMAPGSALPVPRRRPRSASCSTWNTSAGRAQPPCLVTAACGRDATTSKRGQDHRGRDRRARRDRRGATDPGGVGVQPGRYRGPGRVRRHTPQPLVCDPLAFTTFLVFLLLLYSSRAGCSITFHRAPCRDRAGRRNRLRLRPRAPTARPTKTPQQRLTTLTGSRTPPERGRLAVIPRRHVHTRGENRIPVFPHFPTAWWPSTRPAFTPADERFVPRRWPAASSTDDGSDRARDSCPREAGAAASVELWSCCIRRGGEGLGRRLKCCSGCAPGERE